MRPISLLVRKDLRVLRRSPVLLATLLAYPVVIALLVGLVAGYASSKPRVALVDEAGLPGAIVLGGQRFDVRKTIRQVSKNVTLVRLPRAEAQRQLRNGKVVAVITVPHDFLSNLRGMLHSPQLQVQTGRGNLSSRVFQQIQALVYSLNRQLQSTYIKTNLGYVDALKHGATITFLGREIDILGLDRTAQLLEQLPPSPTRNRIIDFVHDANLALAETGSAMRATANPIELVRVSEKGRTWALSAQVQSYALALTIAFLTLMLAAGALAAERDENVIGRLARGLVGFGQLVAAKIALAGAVALALGAAIAVAFGLIIQIGGVEGESRGTGCRCCSPGWPLRAPASGRSARCSAGSRARRGRRPSSRCSSSYRSSSSASSRRKPSRRRPGSARRFRSPTQSSCSGRRCST